MSPIFNVVDLAPFVDPLDLRISLSQPGENCTNVGDQTQAHLLTLISTKVKLWALNIFLTVFVDP